MPQQPTAQPLRIIPWNIRAGGGKRAAGILAQLQAWQPDVIGLSEFRGTPASQTLATQLSASGWPHQLTTIDPEQPAKNALLLASRYPLTAITHPHMPDNPRRWLLAQVACTPALTLTVGLMHVPNYTTPTLKYPFLTALLEMANDWDGGAALIMGDANCGKRGIDEEKLSPPRFHREHEWVVGMEARGWIDAFRHLHGDAREFTWYSHRNNGFRLDYAFGSPHLRDALTAVRHAWGVNESQPGRREGLSDHAAIIIDLDCDKVM